MSSFLSKSEKKNTKKKGEKKRGTKKERGKERTKKKSQKRVENKQTTNTVTFFLSRIASTFSQKPRGCGVTYYVSDSPGGDV